MTGRSLPVTYMPCVTCQVKANRPQATTAPSRKASRYQRRVGGRNEERSSSFSWPTLFAAAGAVPCGCPDNSDMLASSPLEVVNRGMGAEMLQEPEAAGAAGEPRHPALRIGHVAEN